MNAETVFNVAIHILNKELQRLNNLIVDKLNLRPKNLKNKPLLSAKEV